jgi:CBS domain-containing protein
MVLSGGALAGVWLAAIGWFVLGAGRAEVERAATDDRLRGLLVADLMEAAPVAVHADLALDRFVDDVAWAYRHPTYPVVDAAGRPLGLLPFQRLATIPREAWSEHDVADCMIGIGAVPVVAPELGASEALALLVATPLQRGLVVADGRLVGLVTIHDLARALQLGLPHRVPGALVTAPR